MFYYRVSAGEYDFYEETIICHEKEYSKEEFLEMAKKSPKEMRYEDVAEYLCKEYGFKKLNITTSAHEDWKLYTGYYWK